MPIVCEDIGLSGVVDKMIIDSGNIDIIDYKSGRVVDEDGNLKLEYIVQFLLNMAFYATPILYNIEIFHASRFFDIVPSPRISSISFINDKEPKNKIKSSAPA